MDASYICPGCHRVYYNFVFFYDDLLLSDILFATYIFFLVEEAMRYREKREEKNDL